MSHAIILKRSATARRRSRMDVTYVVSASVCQMCPGADRRRPEEAKGKASRNHTVIQDLCGDSRGRQ
jgi:hypothetical protein